MRIKDVIEYVNRMKPNAFGQDAILIWLDEAEGLVQTEAILIETEEMVEYGPETDIETELLAKSPHDKLYRAYVMAMIDFANGEYDKYRSTMEMFNKYFSEYVIWYADKYGPEDRRRKHRSPADVVSG